MVARINFSKSLRNVMHYNENKVKQNDARFIHAANYAKDTERLGFTDRYKRLEKQLELRDDVKTNVIHISLNFDPSEKLDQQRLKEIADAYMQRIGFSAQPYLVYEHFDAAHPHLHIVSTIIQNNGKRIKTHNIGDDKSEKARIEVEKLFGLIPADSRQRKEAFELKPVNVQKAVYGRSQTKRAITNVLDRILKEYKYTSLPELNAVLRQYNVLADQGSKDSRTYQHNGLAYRVLDEKGNKVGVPIKASDIYSKPGMKFLEGKFQENEKLRVPYKQRVKNAVDLALAKRPVKSFEELQQALRKERIEVVLRQNDKGLVYGVTYVDHEKKCIFNGSDLGKQYSANFLKEKFNLPIQNQPQQFEQKQKQQQQVSPPSKKETQQHTPQQTIPFPSHSKGNDNTTPLPEIIPDGKNVMQELMQPEYINEQIPYELRKQKRNRRRKRHHL